MTLAEMRARRQAQIAAMRAAVDAAAAAGRTDLNETEQAAYDAAELEVGSLATSIGRLERLEQIEASSREVRPGAGRQNGTEPANPGANGAGFRPGGAEAPSEFESFGEFLHSVHFRQNDVRLASLWRNRQDSDVRGEQRMDTGSAGGFMVPTQLRTEIFSMPAQGAVIRPRAFVLPAGSPPDAKITAPILDQFSDAAPLNSSAGVDLFKVAEGGTKPPTGFKLGFIELEPHELAATMDVTDKLLRNWSAASAMVEMLFRRRYVSKEEFMFSQGTGIGEPLGYLNSASGAAIEVNRTTANRIVYADLVEMIANSRGDSIWRGSRRVKAQLMKMTDDAGQFIWQVNAIAGQPPTVLGLPFIEDERCPQLGNRGDLSLADFAQYIIKDGSGPFFASSEHAKFEENTTVFKFFWNVDGSPWMKEPFTTENGDVVSPFVVLGDPA